MKLKSVMLVALLLAVLFSGCIGDGDDVVPTPTPTPEPTPETTPIETPTPEPTPIVTPTPETTPTVTYTPGPSTTIYIGSYAVAPKAPTIYVGEALNWFNIQESPYVNFVLVSEEGLWENQTINSGKNFKYTFNTSGNYTYYCPGYGNSMRGTVTVLEWSEGLCE